MNLKDTYNKIAEEWHKDHQADDWWIEGTEKFVSFLKQGNKVLDVGCGGGTHSRYLSERGLKVTGMDFSNNLIEIAKEENPQVDFMVMDMYEVDKLEGKFDGIFAQASLLHIPRKDMSIVLNNLISKLNDNGVLYIAVKGIYINGLDEEIKEQNDYGYPYKRFFSYHSMNELKDYLEKLELKVIYQDIKKTGKSDWLQIIGKK